MIAVIDNFGEQKLEHCHIVYTFTNYTRYVFNGILTENE